MSDFKELSYYEPFHRYELINGRRWHYLDIPPIKQPAKDVIIMVHGFPDLWYGFRHQIHHFRNLGYRVIPVTLLGFPRSEIPEPPPLAFDEDDEEKVILDIETKPFIEYGLEDDAREASAYSYRFFADSVKILLSGLNIKQAIFFGHDWGSLHASRTAYYRPEIVKKLVTICVPLIPFSLDFLPLKSLIQFNPNFEYQMIFGGVGSIVYSGEKLEELLRRCYTQTLIGNSKSKGKEQPKMGMSEDEFQIYLKEFTRDGRSLLGPVTQYKTRKVNFEYDLQYLKESGQDDNGLPLINIPYLHLNATKDVASLPHILPLLSEMAPNSTIKDIDGTHWILFEKADEVNNTITQWLESKETRESHI